MMQYTIISTKILDPAVKSLLEAKGLQVSEAAFIATDGVASASIQKELATIDANDVLVFTSANAITHSRPWIKDAAFSVFCIAGKTKDAVEEAFPSASVVATAPTGQQLATKIIAAGVQHARLICGNIRRDELPQMLRQHNIALDELVVYQTTETPVRLANRFDAVLFFSPSAVSSFFQVNQLNEHTVCFSIGDTTAAALRQYTSNSIIVAAAPSQEQLAGEIINYFLNQVPC